MPQMSNKNSKLQQGSELYKAPEMRLKECELFELAHVVRVRPVFKDNKKG